MASMTIRNLDDDLKQRLRIQAAEHGRLDGGGSAGDLARAIRARFAPLGGVELDIPPREPMRDPPRILSPVASR